MRMDFMSNILATFVDTNRRWSMRDLGDIIMMTTSEIELWKRDYAYVQFFIRSDVGTNIDIQLRGGEGLSVELFTLDTTRAFIGHAGWYARNPKGIMPTGPKVDVDDILAPFEPFAMQDSGYKCVFAKISSSDMVGVRRLYFDVMDGANIGVTLVLGVNILPIDMPSPTDFTFKVEYWNHPYNVAEYYGVEPWSTEHLDIMREHQKLYKELGGSGVTCTVLDEVWGGQTYSKNEIRYPSMVKWIYDRGKWSFDYTDFDKWVDLNVELGLDDKFICYSMMPWGNLMRYYDKGKSKYVNRHVPTLLKGKYQRAWRVFLTDFVRHLDERDMFDSVYIGFDERNNMDMILDFLDTFVNKDGHHFKIAASFNNYIGNKQCLDRIDSASVGLDEIKAHQAEYERIVAERASEGKCTTMYTATEHYPNSFALSLPAESYWSIIYARSTGNNGFLRWAFDAWVEAPLVDTTHWSFQAGDCFLIYPAKQGYKPSLSYRLVKLDEAVRDVNKLAVLAQNEELAGGISKIFDLSRKNYTYRDEYNKTWGKAIRHAKWADEEAKIAIWNDVNNMKRGVIELTHRYIEGINKVQ